MEKSKKEKIKLFLTEFFSKADEAEFYFIKGLKEFSDSILIKSKKKWYRKAIRGQSNAKKRISWSGDRTFKLDW